jgi:4-amino-4-deoxy-L-arabinose transferase-like glycosyltransferase
MNNLHYTFNLTAEINGFTSIILVSILTYIFALRRPDISDILFVALAIRVFVIIAGHYFISLPDSTADARSFELQAWQLGKEGFFSVISNFNLLTHRFDWFIAIPYSLFGRSLLMAKSFSLLFGMGSVLLGLKLASLLWNNSIARKVGWAIALFPSLILYSTLVMREVYISFFLLVALYGACDWVKTKNFKSIIITIAGFVGAGLFHGPMMIGAMMFAVIVGMDTIKKIFRLLIESRINLKTLTILLMLILSVYIYTSNKVRLTYMGSFKETANIKNLIRKTKSATHGKASWPEWTKIDSPIELLYKPLVRSIYFVFAPFPWDIKKTAHLIGLFDACLYMYLVYLILYNIKNIWRDPRLRVILLILIAYIIVFGFGVGNFGTGIRHRSKFVIFFILLAAPLINRFIFFKKPNKI